jgi:glycosyltransferase involved in cell wall biosynthesis
MSPRSRSLRILGFESFDTGSHRAVRESITRWSRHEWTWLTRSGRAWKWGMRLGAIELVDQATARGVLEGALDAVFVTSLISAADLRALLPASLRALPMILYMHENQATYPARGEPDPRDVHFALTNLTSILAADLTIWNSRYNRESFLCGIGRILEHVPSGSVNEVRDRIERKSTVIWPPVERPPESVKRSTGPPGRVLHNPVRVVWPHRWEHDKGPEALLQLARRYTGRLDLRWTILGERFEKTPPALNEFERRFSDRIDHVGFEPDRYAYWQRLADCDWVLSTATHEFFGIAVVEAMLAGCLPWLPNRLSYPELLPTEARDLSPAKPPQDPQATRAALARHLEPALAGNAVGRLDESIRRCVSR